MTRMKASSAAFRHIESEIHSYHDTVKEIKKRREELLSKPAEELVGGRPNTPGDPTGSIVSRLVDDKRLMELERIAYAIETVYNMLDNEHRELVRLYYWTKPQTLTWDGIALRLNVSRRTAIYRRKQIVQAVGERLGWA